MNSADVSTLAQLDERFRSIVDIRSLQGGDINDVYKATTNNGTFCLKQNTNSGLTEMLQKEALALAELHEKTSFHVPKVIADFQTHHAQFLVMEFIESGDASAHFWTDFGEKLAAMHRMTRTSFGWDSDNYIGTLHQSNKNHETWSEFYCTERILPQTKLAVDRGKCPHALVSRIEKLCATIHNHFPEEPPALLHGDLWSGNYMIDSEGQPVLIDPALYYGHREMDLGMMQLFGGFHPSLFTAYDNVYPLEHDWPERIPLTQLYPLLVHVNLFGGGYLQQVERIVDRYC